MALGLMTVFFKLTFCLFSRSHADDGEDEQESAMSAAKGKLLSKIVKKNILENIMKIARGIECHLTINIYCTNFDRAQTFVGEASLAFTQIPYDVPEGVTEGFQI